MSWRIMEGDCRDALATLDAGSVQTCVTSPPYFGLRDYGTGEWEGGGDPACDHIRWVASKADDPGIRSSTLQSNKKTKELSAGTLAHLEQQGKAAQYRNECGKCGATRVDRQIGLEPTPDEFVQALVGVFREIRRVLRDDGTVFLNLGDSYASGAAVSMQRVRGDGDRARPSQGDVSTVLSPNGAQTMDHGEPGARTTQDGRVSPSAQGSGERRSDGTSAGGSAQSHGPHGEPLPVLRGDDAGVSDDRSRTERWGSGPEVGPPPDAQADAGRGVPAGAVSDPVLELQCGEGDARGLSPYGDLKPKDLIGIPWMVAFALRADGWYLRSDIIWSKLNPMPESVTDRPTKAHEYLFMLSKQPRYYYDADAIREEHTSDFLRTPGPDHQDDGRAVAYSGNVPRIQRSKERTGHEAGRNKRSVWTVATQPFAGAHFATFPPKLIEPCILAGSRPGDTILDPFSGAGTTGLVALRHDRSYVGVELNPEYAEMSRWRLRDDAPLLNTGLEEAA